MSISDISLFKLNRGVKTSDTVKTIYAVYEKNVTGESNARK